MGIGEFPQQAENRFRVTKALLAEEFDSLTKRLCGFNSQRRLGNLSENRY